MPCFKLIKIVIDVNDFLLSIWILKDWNLIFSRGLDNRLACCWLIGVYFILVSCSFHLSLMSWCWSSMVCFVVYKIIHKLNTWKIVTRKYSHTPFKHPNSIKRTFNHVISLLYSLLNNILLWSWIMQQWVATCYCNLLS